MIWMAWLFVFLAMMAGIFFGLYQRVKKKGRSVADKLREEYGSDLKLVSGCGIITSHSRVPGVLALLKDRIVHKSLMAGGNGEIYLHTIIGFSAEDTHGSRYPRARKYRNARVLAFKTDKGEEKLFVVEKANAPAWEKSLKKYKRD